ncbi:glycosyltransferase family 9 protein [Terriglobus albidus]|uniref:glycosyltransferase family 9 protein n=1 Tax=Terriglobus albidus TaxID=1592106 RepID=UPI0021E0C8DC|nr:hypothetical protein [Terriglobus albidus]
MNIIHSTLKLAEQYLELRSLDDALACFTLAERMGADPDRCACGRWFAWMLLGEFEHAWEESDAIRSRGIPDPHRFWQGQDIREQRVIVRCLHGLGDAVQQLRYIAPLRMRAKNVIVQTPPELMELAACVAGDNNVISWITPHQPEPYWDVQVEVTELSYLFRSTVDSIPPAPYLPLPHKAIESALFELGPRRRPRIGVVWQAGSWDSARSIPLHQLLPVFEMDGLEFWNLQGGPARRQWSELPFQGRLRDCRACEHGLLSLASVISHLDLVITVDTLVAHLAGALDIPTWVLLQHAADWRWLVSRSDCPWYSSVRLFRQHRPGTWEPVIRAVEAALRDRRKEIMAA